MIGRSGTEMCLKTDPAFLWALAKNLLQYIVTSVIFAPYVPEADLFQDYSGNFLHF